MNNLTAKIQSAQRDAGERAVSAQLEAIGLVSSLAPLTEAAKLELARNAAHAALRTAERAWYAYAALCDVGPERIVSFEVYEDLRTASRVR